MSEDRRKSESLSMKQSILIICNAYILYLSQTHTHGYGKEISEKGQMEDKRRMTRLYTVGDESAYQPVCWNIIEVPN